MEQALASAHPTRNREPADRPPRNPGQVFRVANRRNSQSSHALNPQVVRDDRPDRLAVDHLNLSTSRERDNPKGEPWGSMMPSRRRDLRLAGPVSAEDLADHELFFGIQTPFLSGGSRHHFPRTRRARSGRGERSGSSSLRAEIFDVRFSRPPRSRSTVRKSRVACLADVEPGAGDGRERITARLLPRAPPHTARCKARPARPSRLPRDAPARRPGSSDSRVERPSPPPPPPGRAPASRA